ncbi:MAG: V-type ATP synthase subunit I [Clostridiales bacterium]|jgi:V/A-type H+-transporting ATPase subunit I|nr:V-type ATP synthase subunit I [Clostridiales bacterium]
MAIVKMSKFTLFTFQANKGELLKKLQIYQNIHFKNLSTTDMPEYLKKDFSNEQFNFYTEGIAKLTFIIQKLKPLKPKEKGFAALTTPKPSFSYDEFEKFSTTYDYQSLYEKLKSTDEGIRELKQKISRLETDNVSYQNWHALDVSTKQLSSLKYSSYLLGNVNKANFNSFKEALEKNYQNFYLEHLGDSKDDSHVLIIFEKGITDEFSNFLRDNGFSKASIEFPGLPESLVKGNNSEIAKLKNDVASLESGNKEFVSELDNTLIIMDYYESMLERVKISGRFLKTNEILILEGWLPQDEVKNLEGILNEACRGEYFIELEEVEYESTEVPIKLKNNKLVQAFESITAMFNMPKYNEIDPTPLLTPFYILFFGVMVGDIGYGLVLVIATFLAIKFLALNEGTKNFMRFLLYCGFGTIFAGILFGGAFGVTVFAPIQYTNPTTNELGYKAILDSNWDIVTMMVLSVAIGFIHIIFGLLVKGYMNIRDGKILSAIFDSGFFITTLFSAVGLLLGTMGVLPAGVGIASKWVLIASLIGLLVTQGRDCVTMVGKIAQGAYSVYGLTSYVGDFVSYTRLVALSLSGAYVAISFNQMIGLLPPGIIKIILGAVIFLLSQTLNIGLAVLGAYVHSCRLQYVEFFGKFYEGGGVPFRPFSFNNKYINLKE